MSNGTYAEEKLLAWSLKLNESLGYCTINFKSSSCSSLFESTTAHGGTVS